MLIKINCTAEQRGELVSLASVSARLRPSLAAGRGRWLPAHADPAPSCQRRGTRWDLATPPTRLLTPHRASSPRRPHRQIFRALVCDVSVGTLTLEVTGKEDKMVALKEVLEPYGARPGPHMMRGGVRGGRAAGAWRRSRRGWSRTAGAAVSCSAAGILAGAAGRRGAGVGVRSFEPARPNKS